MFLSVTACLQLLFMGTSAGAPAACAQSTKAPITASHRLDQLRSQLQSSSAKERIAALKSLAALGPSAARAVPDIITVLNDNRSFGVGEQFAQRVSPVVTDAALEALTKIGPRAHEAAPYLVQILGDRNELFRRQQVMDALSSVRVDGSATKTLMRVAAEEGKFTKTRLQAIQLLGKVRPPATDAVDTLKEIAEDKTDSLARQAALESISDISRAMSHASTAADREQAISSESKEQLELKSKLSADQSKSDRLEALHKVADLADKGAPFVPKLISLLDDSDAEIISADLDALSGIGQSAAAATPSLVAHLFKQKDAALRSDLCRTVSLVDPQGKLSIPLLQPALDDPFKAKIALELLDELGTDRSSSVAEATRKRWCLK